MKIGLISCSSQKLSYAAPARELYCSPLFRMSLRFAELECDKTYVLSAKHGLVDLDTVIEPYDDMLSKQSKRMRFAWGSRVASSVLFRHQQSPIVLLAGFDYMLALRHGMAGTDQHRIQDPMKGMMIGQRLAFLKKHGPAEIA